LPLDTSSTMRRTVAKASSPPARMPRTECGTVRAAGTTSSIAPRSRISSPTLTAGAAPWREVSIV